MTEHSRFHLKRLERYKFILWTAILSTVTGTQEIFSVNISQAHRQGQSHTEKRTVTKSVEELGTIWVSPSCLLLEPVNLLIPH